MSILLVQGTPGVYERLECVSKCSRAHRISNAALPEYVLQHPADKFNHIRHAAPALTELPQARAMPCPTSGLYQERFAHQRKLRSLRFRTCILILLGT